MGLSWRGRNVLTDVDGLVGGNGHGGVLHIYAFSGNCYLPSGVKVKIG